MKKCALLPSTCWRKKRPRRVSRNTRLAGAARLDAGGVGTQIKEAVRDVRAGALWETIWHDIRHAVRQLRHSPAFTWTAVLSLALGVGANTAVFTVVRAVLIAPLPYPGADRLAVVWGHAPRMGALKDHVSFANYADWKQQNQVFTDMAAAVERTGGSARWRRIRIHRWLRRNWQRVRCVGNTGAIGPRPHPGR